MKRIVLLALLVLALPLAAFGTSVTFDNNGGILTASGSGSSETLSLNGSNLTSILGFNGIALLGGADLGSVSFTTGALLTGNTMDGATFAPGGSFEIMGNTKDGMPAVIFKGTFTSITTWTIPPGTTPGVSDSIYYTLRGYISGTWYNGLTVSGATTQMTIDAGKNGFMDSVSMAGGITNFTVTPEPGTLALLGTGLVGLAGIVRKKYKS